MSSYPDPEGQWKLNELERDGKSSTGWQASIKWLTLFGFRVPVGFSLRASLGGSLPRLKPEAPKRIPSPDEKILLDWDSRDDSSG